MSTTSPTRVTVSIPTADLRRAFAFYKHGLGLKLATDAAEGEMPEPVQFRLDQHTHLMLVPTRGFEWVLGENAKVAAAGTSECVLGLSFETEAEVNALVERARNAGAEIVTEPTMQPWGYAATLRDLDGHLWMFTTARA
jgi:predicted lactoylglutathione lyase